MTTIKRYTAADADSLFNEIQKTLSPYSIGLFDSLGLNEIKRFEKSQTNYPPYNIKKKGDNFIVEIAVAGFSKEAITIEYKDRTLTVKGENPTKDEDVEIVFNGLANRAFTRTFTIADTLVVENASLDNGILTITCKQLIPEHLKPKTIPINCSSSKTEVDSRQLLCED